MSFIGGESSNTTQNFQEITTTQSNAAGNMGGTAIGDNITIVSTDGGAVLSAVALAERVTRAAIEENRGVLADALGFGRETLDSAFYFGSDALNAALDFGKESLDFANRNATISEAATRNALEMIDQATRSDETMSSATLIKSGAVVLVALALAWAMRGGK